VIQTYNPSYVGGGGRRIAVLSSRPALGKNRRPHLKSKSKKELKEWLKW
jgi:hypothetical protein